jgi:hypothetical protein
MDAPRLLSPARREAPGPAPKAMPKKRKMDEARQ